MMGLLQFLLLFCSAGEMMISYYLLQVPSLCTFLIPVKRQRIGMCRKCLWGFVRS